MAFIQRLTLTAFRNYERLRLETGPGCIVVTGPNGAGKTNLLEAVSLMAPGRGMRGARLSDIGRAGSPEAWAVAVTVSTQQGEVDAGTSAEPGSERRVVRIDGTNRNQSALSSLAAVLWLTPSMDRLFAEPSSARRKFIDRIVYGYDQAHATRVNRYDLALRERQKLLEENRHPAWLDGIETVLAETGIAIAVARSRMAQRLHDACAHETGPFPRPALVMTGELEDWLSEAPALTAEDRFRALLMDNRMRDRAAGRCLTGAHRSDLAATYRGLPASLGSTGEQKGLVIAIMLANAALMTGQAVGKPILLLDEITAHLDPVRRTALFQRLADLQVQAWMTGTEPSMFDALPQARHLRVQDGQVRDV